MVDHSKPSQPTGKQRTRKTVELSREEALQILQESFRVCEAAGIVMEVETDAVHTRITLRDVAYFEGNLIDSTNIGT
jgi:hypothetical protein